jgi:hypothetical protein
VLALQLRRSEFKLQSHQKKKKEEGKTKSKFILSNTSAIDFGLTF